VNDRTSSSSAASGQVERWIKGRRNSTEFIVEGGSVATRAQVSEYPEFSRERVQLSLTDRPAFKFREGEVIEERGSAASR